MNNLEKNIFYAKNLQEIFYSLKNIKNLKLIEGATGLETLPEKSLSIINIPELKKISKHERYIEFGPATSLSQILNLGERHIPKILFDALSTIANPFVRNIATIGGNIMGDFWYHTLYAPLLALDARLELKTENETTYKSLVNFTGLKENQIISNIRLPLSDWDIEFFMRTGPESKITEESASFSFLALSEKNIITSIRIAFAGPFAFRNLEFESKLIGLKLPLNDKNIASIMEDAEFYFTKEKKDRKIKAVLESQFLNLLKYSLEHLK